MKVLVLVTLLVFCTVPFASWADTTGSVKQSIADAGNKFCPVSGDKVSGKHFVEYQGKKYGLCCPMCEKDFKKDPEKYIAELSKSEQQNDHGSSEMAEPMDHDHAH